LGSVGATSPKPNWNTFIALPNDPCGSRRNGYALVQVTGDFTGEVEK
jgi:hypothetical protein